MNGVDATTVNVPEEKRNLKDIIAFILSELKPRGKMLTPFNVISGVTILLGAFLILYRLVKGLGAVSNLSQEFPWGIWIGFDVMVGVAFAGGAYVLTFVAYVLRFGQIPFHHQGNRPERPACLCLLCRRNFPRPRPLVEYHQSALRE